MNDCTPQEQDSGRITTSIDVIADLHDEIERLERELAERPSQTIESAQSPAPQADAAIRNLLATMDDENYIVYPRRWLDAMVRLRASLRSEAAPSQDAEDSSLLDWLKEHTCDLRCVSSSEDDYDWVVIEHHEAKPNEREIGRAYSYDPRDAIRAARAQQEGK